MFFQRRIERYQRLQRLSVEIEFLGGAIAWLETQDLWRRDYYGSPEYNTIEPIGARSFVHNVLFGREKLLHVELKGLSISPKLAKILSSDEIVSFDIFDCRFESQPVRLSRSTRFARIETLNDADTIPILNSLSASKVEWLSLRMSNLSEENSMAIAKCEALELLSIHVLTKGDVQSLHKLNALKELYLIGFDDLQSSEIESLLQGNLERIHVFNCAIPIMKQRELIERFPTVSIGFAGRANR